MCGHSSPCAPEIDFFSNSENPYQPNKLGGFLEVLVSFQSQNDMQKGREFNKLRIISLALSGIWSNVDSAEISRTLIHILTSNHGTVIILEREQFFPQLWDSLGCFI